MNKIIQTLKSEYDIHIKIIFNIFCQKKIFFDNFFQILLSKNTIFIIIKIVFPNMNVYIIFLHFYI